MSESAERLRQLRALFDVMMDQPPERRRAYLDGLDDAVWPRDMRDEVWAMLDLSGDTDPRLSVGRGVAGDAGSLAGQRIGPYEIIRKIGSGGMGVVYEAMRADDQYHKRVALKIVQGALTFDLTLARFRRERQILASLEHRNIATLLDGGVTSDGRPFLVMEYVEGEPITTWCDARRSAIRDRIALFRQVCGAVQYAHKNLVVHRDLKPANIFVTADGTVKLLDFGIAKLLNEELDDPDMPLTRGGARPFTPEYASPEQIRGTTLTTASDVYALGVVLYELLTGRLPHRFAGHSLADIERTVFTDPISRPSVVITDAAAIVRDERSAARARRTLHGELDQIALMALRIEPERRYASAEALNEDLRRYLTGMPVAAQRDWFGYRFRTFARRNRAAVVASSLVVLALIGGIIATSIQAKRAREQQHTAERVSGLLRDLLSSTSPTTGGQDIPVSTVLDAAAKRLANDLQDEPDVRAELESVIGQSYQSLGRYDAASQSLTRALAIRERVSGSGSTEAISALVQLGGVYLAQGRFDKADTVFRDALARDQRSSHPDTLLATIMSNLGTAAHNRGDNKAAERWHRQALAIRQRAFGPHDDIVAYSLGNVAVALGEQNEWASAESLHRAALQILRTNHPNAATPEIADAENALATALDLQGKNAAADSMYRLVLTTRRELLGPDHPEYAYTLFTYAMFVFDQKRYTEAYDLSRQVLALRGKTLPNSHPAVAAALMTEGRCLDQMGDTAEARRALEESIALRQQTLAPNNWLIASSQSVLGEHFVHVHDFAKGERLLIHADSVMTAEFGVSNLRTQANLQRLVELYDAWGQPSKAAYYRAKLTAHA